MDSPTESNMIDLTNLIKISSNIFLKVNFKSNSISQNIACDVRYLHPNWYKIFNNHKF